MQVRLHHSRFLQGALPLFLLRCAYSLAVRENSLAHWLLARRSFNYRRVQPYLHPSLPTFSIRPFMGRRNASDGGFADGLCTGRLDRGSRNLVGEAVGCSHFCLQEHITLKLIQSHGKFP